MAAFRGPRVWLWRWRRNPLRRRVDAVEGWAVLATWALIVLTGVFVGLVSAHSVEEGLARERVDWRPVTALVVEDAPGTVGSEKVWAKVRWSAADGTRHTGQARVDSGSTAGSPATVWTDPQGRLVTKPATESEAHLRAALIGALAGASGATVPYVGWRLLRGRLQRRRMEEWDEAWERFDPMWGRNTR
ncbi:Rv1733c family protein [Streptomyces sp. B21-083]|uniref:Rv1733c family protein n=1 Tax=Streptomyces sp. B21-083 TaxID=3039410 RepID=UPI002FF26CD4